MVEIRIDVPPEELERYKAWQAEQIPTVRIVREGSNIEDLAARANAALSHIDRDKVRVVDIYHVSKNTNYWPQTRATIKRLKPNPPPEWLEFYGKLSQREKNLFGVILRPLVESHDSLAGISLSELNGRTFARATDHPPAEYLASTVFGILYVQKPLRLV